MSETGTTNGLKGTDSTVEEKMDEVITVDDLFPINLRKPSKSTDTVDAKNDNAPPLPAKMHGDVVPAFHDLQDLAQDGNIRNAGSLLQLDMPESNDAGISDDDEESVHKTKSLADEIVHGKVDSESIKAFFSVDRDTVDAGAEPRVSYEYNMKHKHRGCFLIFNHMHFLKHLGVNPRKGTGEDKKNLEKTAQKLGFEYIRSFDDLDVHDIFQWVRKVANADHSSYDCFAMAILTHGDEGDILYAHDAKYSIDAITELFMARNCPSLAGKPKMFFIQACRGQMLDEGAPVGDTVDAKLTQVANKSKKEIVIIPNAADFLLAFSTAPGYYAWRNQACGSWFIQALCKCLREFGDRLELMQIMTRVNRMVAYDFTSYSKQNLDFDGKKQIPSIVTRLTHEVFFRKKNGSGSPSPFKSKHRLPVFERKKVSPDGKIDPNNGIRNEALSNENKLAGLKETHL